MAVVQNEVQQRKDYGVVEGYETTGIGRDNGTVSAAVPNDSRAKLMYYLNCVCTVLNLDDEPGISRLIDYKNYFLSDEETARLITLCYMLSPHTLLNKCIFHNEEQCGDMTNRFFSLGIAQTHLPVDLSESVMIGGQKNIKNIMFFKTVWLERNWLNPFKELVQNCNWKAERELGCSCWLCCLWCFCCPSYLVYHLCKCIAES